jgi:hypothetical protein
MFVSADQLVLHVLGDYVTQTDHMALNKVQFPSVAALHALIYTLPFLFLTQSPYAMVFIFGSHMLIDHYRLARYVAFAKNQFAPALWRRPWEDCNVTGYHKARPVWMTVWLYIVIDNFMHVLCNAAAIRYL